MRKSLSNFFTILSIKSQVASIVFLALLGISGYVAYSLLSNRQPAVTEAQYRTNNELQNLNQTHQLMRNHETDYFEDSEPENITEFHKHNKAAISSLNHLIKGAQGDRLDILTYIKQDIFEYQHIFENSVTTNISLGNSQYNGFEGELNQAFNKISTQVTTQNLKSSNINGAKSNKLGIELLTLRHEEMNFMLRPEASNLVRVQNQIDKFNSVLATSSLSPLAKLQISQNVEIYSLKFRQWNQTRIYLETQLEQLDILYDTFSFAIEELLIEYELVSEFIDKQTASERELSKLFLIISIVVIVILSIAIEVEQAND